MARIYLGTAGIPLSSKGKSTADGIRRVRELGLNAMEVEFVRGVKMGLEKAAELKKVAEEENVRLSVHAPYFINLCSEEKDKAEASKNRILETASRAEAMGADAIAIHVAFYKKGDREKCMEIVKSSMGEIIDRAEESNIKTVKFGIET
ncbi:TIM barrel protein, partial [Acidianus sp. RZ1]